MRLVFYFSIVLAIGILVGVVDTLYRDTIRAPAGQTPYVIYGHCRRVRDSQSESLDRRVIVISGDDLIVCEKENE